MLCPNCKSPNAIRNGSGRAFCRDCKTYPTITSVERAELAQEAIHARQGHAPGHDMTRTTPAGFMVKGVSTLYDKDGKMAAQWVKTDQDREQMLAVMNLVLESMREEVPREKARSTPVACDDSILCQYTITDYHLGMLAWGEETGAPWDLQIAEDTLVAWFAEAIAMAPAAAVAVFAQLGDMLHWDGMDAVTPTSGHLLDADTRFQKLVRVAIRVIRRVIGMLLTKHGQVIVIMAEGNHDMASSIWLRELLAALYDDEPRVTVNVSPDPYYCVEHGKTALFYHHGHKKKPEQIDSVFVAKFREIFGRTKFAYAHMGHMHHVYAKETNLMVVEQHRTLSASDAHASRGGWISGRDAKVITYSKEYGKVGEIVLSYDFVRDRMAA